MIPIRTRTELINLVAATVKEVAIARAIRQGDPVRVLGGFHSIPPGKSSGWILSVRSRLGRNWFVAVVPDQIKHFYTVRMIETVPWEEWAGLTTRKEWNMYDGDIPTDYAAKRDEALAYGRGESK